MSSCKRLKHQPEPTVATVLRMFSSYGDEPEETDSGFFAIDCAPDDSNHLRLFPAPVQRSRHRAMLLEKGLSSPVSPPPTSEAATLVECARRCIPFLKEPREESNFVEFYTNRLYQIEWKSIKDLYATFYPTSNLRLVLSPVGEKRLLSVKVTYKDSNL